MKLLFSALILASASSSFAALPPYDDSIKQIETIIQSKKVAQAANGAPIMAVKKMGSLDYEIDLAQTCSLIVSLDSKEPTDGRKEETTYTVLSVSQKRCL